MPNRLLIFVLFSSAYFLSFFYRSANAVIAPDLAREMSLGAAQLGLMTSVFFATFALAQLPIGVALDRVGPRQVTSTLLFIGAAGSLVFAGATSFGGLTLGRGVIGVGMAGVLMGSLKAFSAWFPVHRIATVSGLLVGIGSTGAIFAATPLALLNQALGWRAVFAYGAALTTLAGLAILLFARNTPPGVPWRPGHPSDGSLATVFRDPRFWRVVPLTFFMAGVLQAVQGLWGGPYLFDGYGLSQVQGSSILLAIGVGASVGFALGGWLSDHVGLRRVIIGSAIVFALVQAVLAARPPLWAVWPLFLVFGLTGAANILLLANIRHMFPAALGGRAMSAVNLFGIGGAFILQWWMGVIIGAFPAAEVGHYAPQAFTTALGFTAVGTGLALLWYLPLRRAKPVGPQTSVVN